MRRIEIFIVLMVAAMGAGCSAKYVTPSAGADMSTFGVSRERQTDASIQERLKLQPLVRFPAAIAVVRVQSPGYHSYTTTGYGDGRYSVVTTRDIEPADAFDRLARLAQVSGVTPLSRILLPVKLESDRELRQAAASLHADLVFIYTLDTQFRTRDLMTPLSIVSLGLSPNQQAVVVTTASAALLDTRNGYVYAVAETTENGTQMANEWTNEDAVDDTRKRTETAAFLKLLKDFERVWPTVVTRYGSAARASD